VDRRRGKNAIAAVKCGGKGAAVAKTRCEKDFRKTVWEAGSLIYMCSLHGGGLVTVGSLQ